MNKAGSTRVRQHIRSNVVGYVALFIALSGTAYATHPGGANTISSGDLIDNEVRNEDIRDGNVTSADLRTGSVVTGKIADGAVTSPKVQDNSLTGADISNPTRAVNLPISGFVGVDDVTNDPFSIPFNDAANDANDDPSYVTPGSGGVRIEWDADSNIDDNDGVSTSFVVPPDYASGGEVALLGVIQGPPGNDDWRVLDLEQNVGNPEDTGHAIHDAPNCDTHAGTPVAGNVYVCIVGGFGADYAPGDGILIQIRRLDSSPDATQLLAVEFRYTATQ